MPLMEFDLFILVELPRSGVHCTLDPAYRLGVVVEGGLVKSVMISVTTCFKKSSNFTQGNGIVKGKMLLYHSFFPF